MANVQLIALDHFPLVQPGDDLFRILCDALEHNKLSLQEDDVLVLAQKIVSKAENRYVDLKTIDPSPAAFALAEKSQKDPRHMQVLLQESKEVIKTRPGAVIVEHRNGYVHANAGIDHSNIQQQAGKELLLLLPENPDHSAHQLHEQISESFGLHIPVLINDSFGRPFRNGVCGVCIGSAGLEVLHNRIGDRDLFGNVLEITQIATADEIAAAASMLMGQADEGQPVVIVRGLRVRRSNEGSQALLRKKSEDLFRQ